MECVNLSSAQSCTGTYFKSEEQMSVNRAAFFASLFAVSCCFVQCPAIAVAVQTEEVERLERDPLDESAHLLAYGHRCGLKLYSIPAAHAADQTIKTKSNAIELGFGRAVGVFGGQLFSLFDHEGQLLAVDINEGGVRTVNSAVCNDDESVVDACYASGHLYLVVKLKRDKDIKSDTDHALVHLDLTSAKVTRICELSSRRSQMQYEKAEFTFEASPDGLRVAVSEMKKYKKPETKKELLFGGFTAPTTRIVLASAGDSKVVRTDYSFQSQLVMTGGGDYFAPPQFVWGSDDELVVLVSLEREERDRLGLGAGTPDDFRIPWTLKLINADSGVVTPYLDLPFKGVCDLVNNRGPRPIVKKRGEGRCLLDFRNKSLGDPNVVADDYELKPTDMEDSYSLNFQNEVQEVHAKPGRVFPSKRGKRVAWFTLPAIYAIRGEALFNVHRRNDHGHFIHANADLKIHDSVHGVRTLGTEWFGGGDGYLCMWLGDADLERSDALEGLLNGN